MREKIMMNTTTYPHLTVTVRREDAEDYQQEGGIARMPALAAGGTLVTIVASTEHIRELLTRVTRFTNDSITVEIPLHAIEGAV